MTESRRRRPSLRDLRSLGVVPPVDERVLADVRRRVEEAARELPIESASIGPYDRSVRFDLSRRQQWVGVGGLLAAVAASVVFVAIAPWAVDTTRPDVVASGTGELPGEASGGCAFEYSPETLAERTLAFDGTVEKIDSGGPFAGNSVEIRVEEWFVGKPEGVQEFVVVNMAPPSDQGAGQYSDSRQAESPTYTVGTRLLVAGESTREELLVWGCGFTRYYEPATSDEWRRAFGS